MCAREHASVPERVCACDCEQRGCCECVCAYTRVCMCVHTCMHICAGACVRVRVCACGLRSWSRVPWPVFLLPRPPSQQVLTQGGMGSLLSGFPGWVEVVPWKGNNCALKWTLRGLGCAAPCGVQGHQAMCPPRLGVQRPYRQALPTSEPTRPCPEAFPKCSPMGAMSLGEGGPGTGAPFIAVKGRPALPTDSEA